MQKALLEVVVVIVKLLGICNSGGARYASHFPESY